MTEIEEPAASSSAPEEPSEGESNAPELKPEETRDEDDASAVDETWLELMGPDLQLKVLEKDESVEEPVAVQPQDAVVVDFVGRLAQDRDDEDGPIFHQAKDWLVVVAEKDVLPVLEMGIRFMHVSERSVVWSRSKFAYGPLTRKNGDYELPPNANVRYEVTVKSIASSEQLADPSFQIQMAKAKKEIANDVYVNEWSDGYGKQRALLLYKRAADMMEYLVQSSDEDDDSTIRNEARSVMLDCLNNTVAVHLRAKQYHEAKEAVIKVLTHDPENFKGLIRAAKASMLDPASSYEEVEMSIAAAEVNHADDAEVQKLRAELKQRKQEYKKKSKAMYSKMANVKKEPSAKKTIDTETRDAARESDTKDSGDQGTKMDWKAILWPYVIQLVPALFFWALFKWKQTQQTAHQTTMQDATDDSSGSDS